MFAAALDAARPQRAVPPNLPAKPKGRTIVVGAGKASAAMASALEEAWEGPLEGLVVVPYGHVAPCRLIEVVEARHPTPDAAGEAAAMRTLDLVSNLSADDLVIALISGGGSALWSLPAEGLALAEKQAITRALLKSGAAIGEINAVRKRLSKIKGGRLAVAAWPARVATLAISDVPGDDPAVIASGPTVADASTLGEARAVLARYGIAAPALSDTPPADHPALRAAVTKVIAAPAASLEAAARVARAERLAVYILGDDIEGEAREVAADMAQAALAAPRPCVLISGGETTVTVKGRGRGGRNVEFLLALAIALNGAEGVHALAADTDGVDGLEPVAGAVIGPDTLSRARALGLDPAAMLDDNDAHSLFEALGDQVLTGPTLTNVNDFRAIVCL